MVCKIVLHLLGHWALTTTVHGKNYYAYLVEEEIEAQEARTCLSSESWDLLRPCLSTLNPSHSPTTLPTAAQPHIFLYYQCLMHGYFLHSSRMFFKHPTLFLSCPTATCFFSLSLNSMSLSVRVRGRDLFRVL